MGNKWKNYVKSTLSQNEEELFENIKAGLLTITNQDCGGCYRNMLAHIDAIINN